MARQYALAHWRHHVPQVLVLTACSLQCHGVSIKILLEYYTECAERLAHSEWRASTLVLSQQQLCQSCAQSLVCSSHQHHLDTLSLHCPPRYHGRMITQSLRDRHCMMYRVLHMMSYCMAAIHMQHMLHRHVGMHRCAQAEIVSLKYGCNMGHP